MQSPLAAASPIGLLFPLWGGVAPFYGAEPRLWGGAVPIGCFSYGLLLPLWGSAAPLWGRAVAKGWRCPCNAAVLPLGGSAVPIGCRFPYWAVGAPMGRRRPLLWGSAAAVG